MNGRINKLTIQTSPTIALISDDRVLIRLLAFTGTRMDQPMGLFKTDSGNKVYYLYISDWHINNNFCINSLIQKLCASYVEETGKTLTLLTWSDTLYGFWITPKKRVYYLGTFCLFETELKRGYVTKVFEGKLTPADHLRLRDYVYLDSNSTELINDQVQGNGLIEHIHVTNLDEPLDHISAMDEVAGLLFVLSTHVKLPDVEKIKKLIIHNVSKLNPHPFVLKNIHVANYMSKSLLTDSFYDSLTSLTKEKRNPACQTV